MDSFAVVDKTLPLDLNGSSNPNLLTEVTYGVHGLAPMMEKSGTGRMSPVRGRTMKEYDQQLQELKKENFNLKLRIYFMQEHKNAKYNEEDIIRTNIELKVEIENYKTDLQEKTALLEKASETIDTLTMKYSDELEKEVTHIKQECEDKVEQANQRSTELVDELKALNERLAVTEDHLASSKSELDLKTKQLKDLIENLEDKDREITKLSDQMTTKAREVKQLQQQISKNEDMHLAEIETLTTNLGRKDRDVQDAVEDTQKTLKKLQQKCEVQDQMLGKNREMIGKLEDLLRDKDKEKQVLKKAYDERTKVYKSSKEVIQELTRKTQQLMRENERLQAELKSLKDELNDTKTNLEQTQSDRQKEADHVEELQQAIEKLMNTLGKKDGELKNFRDLLEKATKSLSVSEAAVESLQRQLEKERCPSKEVHLQNIDMLKGENTRMGKELEFVKSRLSELEKMYQTKCNELEDLNKLYHRKCAEMDAVAKQLNITMETTLPADGNILSPLQQILAELRLLKEALGNQRHVLIDHHYSHTTVDIEQLTSDAGGTSNRVNGVKQKAAIRNGSGIPVLKGSSSNAKTIELEHQVTKLTAQNEDLQKTLKATEETVHRQTQKMKHYRTILIENGLLSRSRSSSVPNARMSLSPQSRPENRGRCFSSDHLSLRCRSVSPTPSDASGTDTIDNSRNDEKLLKENHKLRQQVDGYRRVLKVFQDRSVSPDSSSESERSGQDGEPAPISSESASCLLESWLDMLEKFLLDLSQSDNNNYMHLHTPAEEISRLRKGLVQARGAIRSLSEHALAGNDSKLSGGRLSPDSGCSDNNLASTLNTMKSSVGSPRDDTSPEPSTSSNSTSSQETSAISSHRQFNTSVQNYSGSNPLNNSFSQFISFSINKSSDGQQKLDGKTISKSTNVTNVTLNSNFSLNNSLTPELGSNMNENSVVYPVDSKIPIQGNDNSVERLCHCSDSANQKDLSEIDRNSEAIYRNSPKYNSNGTAQSLCEQNGANSPIQTSPTCQQDGGWKIEGKRWDKTMSQTYLECFDPENNAVDITANGEVFSMMEDTDNERPVDITQNPSIKDGRNRQQMREQIDSLEEIIRSYEEQLKEQNCPNLDSLQQYLQELRLLRLQLEKSMNDNENLKRELFEQHRFAESTIKDHQREIGHLKNNLAESLDNIVQKDKLISEKEKAIEEISSTLRKYKEALIRDGADLEAYKEKVKSVENDLKNNKDVVDQLTKMCQQLKFAAEQFKRRCEQLETDNKKHTECVPLYQTKIKDIELELKEKSENAEKKNAETVVLHTKIQQLEIDSNQLRENEIKYKNSVAQLSSRANSLLAENENLKFDFKKTSDELISVKSELERSRDTIEEQNQQLFEKNNVIKQLNEENQMKTEFLNQQKTTSSQIRKGFEDLSNVNDKLSTQLEQQRLTCADYKRQIEKQNYIIKDLKDNTDRLRQELTQSIHTRESLDKALLDNKSELRDATRLRDKYLCNLKITFKSCMRYKSELKEAKTKLDETNTLNNTLQTELNVRERLMEGKDHLTDDEKKNMIMELLRELKGARDQMIKIVEQNNTINKQLQELINREKEYASSDKVDQFETDMNISGDSQFSQDSTANNSDGSNQTWPMYNNLISGLTRTDNLSASLPIRGSTPGGQNSGGNCPSNSALSASLPENSDGAIKDILTHFNATSKTNQDIKEAVITSSSHFSVPGPIYRQGISDQCLFYNVNDSPKYLEGVTQVRIDSDIRSLFAVGKIDTFEKLRNETNECKVILKGLLTRISERLKVFVDIPASEMLKSVEYSTLKELSYGTENLRICVDSQLSAIGCFWISELPAPNHKGEFVNQRLLDQNACLRDKLTELMTKYEAKSNSPCSLKVDLICQSLESTLDVMTRAKQNLQLQHEQMMYSPNRSSSRSPRK